MLAMIEVFSGCIFFLSIDGVVVCEEYEQTLLDAWHEEEQQAEKKKAEVWWLILSQPPVIDFLLSYLVEFVIVTR